MGCPLSAQEEAILNGAPLSQYEQDMLENMQSDASIEWRTQIEWLNGPREELRPEVCEPRIIRNSEPRQHEKEAARKRERVLFWMRKNGGTATTKEVQAAYGGRRNLIYKAMEVLERNGLVECVSSNPKKWRIL